MGEDLKDLALADLASNMSVMPQDTYIFSGSIRDNIILNSDDPNDHRDEPTASLDVLIESQSLLYPTVHLQYHMLIGLC